MAGRRFPCPGHVRRPVCRSRCGQAGFSQSVALTKSPPGWVAICPMARGLRRAWRWIVGRRGFQICRVCQSPGSCLVEVPGVSPAARLTSRSGRPPRPTPLGGRSRAVWGARSGLGRRGTLPPVRALTRLVSASQRRKTAAFGRFRSLKTGSPAGAGRGRVVGFCGPWRNRENGGKSLWHWGLRSCCRCEAGGLSPVRFRHAAAVRRPGFAGPQAAGLAMTDLGAAMHNRQGWGDLPGDNSAYVGMTTFGASSPARTITAFRQYGRVRRRCRNVPTLK
ncbi:hypothetical protein SAMN05421757_101456 [Tropicimonas sediminicola]|uniref:Uncharacterized protein n=1 Tax=Tropicimonas sediminicola TaxID=1031541 RepID=A0A239CV20_9RHOB|nr:hypothetical protein SAMN05421757_101456 [Tropicimonas sediminicola]